MTKYQATTIHLLSVAVAAWLSSAAAETVKVPIELPQPYYGATPSGYIGRNLERTPIYTDPEPIEAPDGTTNVALNKPVTGSAKPNFGELGFVTDGKVSHESNALMELGPGVAWVQIDLEAVHDIYGIVMWHDYIEERVFFDVAVLVSNDPEFEQGVETLFNNDHDNSAERGAGTDKEYKETHRGRVIRVPEGVKGRYVRIYSNGNDSDLMNRYIEVQVFGVPEK